MKVELREATKADAQQLFEWRNDPLTRSMSRSRDALGFRSHQEWLESRLEDPESLLLLAEADGRPFGMIRFDRLPDGAAEVSINTSPASRGRGLGSMCLIAACEEVRRRDFTSAMVAQVRLDNPASQRIFAKAGFVETARSGEWITLIRPAARSR